MIQATFYWSRYFQIGHSTILKPILVEGENSNFCKIMPKKSVYNSEPGCGMEESVLATKNVDIASFSACNTNILDLTENHS